MSRTLTRRSNESAEAPWTGAVRHYDILKEGVIALIVVSLLSIGLAAVFSSPDDPQLTFKSWATSSPDNFFITTVGELAGTTESAGYGPPYNDGSDGIAIGPINLQKLSGVRIPVDPANDFVIGPLSESAQSAELKAALSAWQAASPDQRTKWASDYNDAISATAEGDNPPDLTKVAAGDFGPVPTLAKSLTAMATAGAYDGALLGEGGFYALDHTKQILFLGDGSALDDFGTVQHLQGNTWGMMNETGSYPGQAWLWLYSFWYQLPVFNAPDDATGMEATLTGGADAIIFYIMGFLTLVLLFLPFIPILRSIPRWIPLHRLIWKQYYRA